MKLIGIGFGNLVSAGRIISIVSPDSAPIKRMIQDARESNFLRCPTTAPPQPHHCSFAVASL